MPSLYPEYWMHQANEPLFPDVIWSKPETAHGSGKLLLAGGSAGSMSKVAAYYQEAEKSGAGTIRLLVPDSLSRVTKGIPNIEYAPSNPSGGFARTALSDFLTISQNVDGVFLAGDMGKNSETSLMLETFFTKYSEGMLVLSPESLESFSISLEEIIKRPETIIILNHNQLREMAIKLQMPKPVTSDMGRAQLAETLHDITSKHQALLVLAEPNEIWVSHRGKVCDCKTNGFAAARAAVWAIQQPEKIYEAVISSVVKEK